VAIQTAQLSANEETKSSAGDKYETGRAMAQLEIENNSAQLRESMKLKQVLEQISFDQKSTYVQIGSLVTTNQGIFYIAISAGQFVIEDETYFAISAASPIGQKLMGLRVDASFTFNKKEFCITHIL
jgi:transcription elongation GreA/GreB family factor